MKKVLIIGGTGTISTPITKFLSEDSDVDLYVLNRGSRKDELPEKVHRLTADIRKDSEQIKEMIKDLYFDSIINFLVMDKNDAKMNIDLFKGKTNQFIFISTVVALDHSVSCNVDEKLPYGNRYSIYGRNKEECEKAGIPAGPGFRDQPGNRCIRQGNVLPDPQDPPLHGRALPGSI